MFVALAAALLGLITVWVLGPLLGWGNADEARRTAAADDRENLLDRRRELLTAIKDLEMEFRIGKLSKEDFEESRERLAVETVDVLKRIDSGGAPAPNPTTGTPDAG